MVKNLRALRTGRGLSQQQLADVIGTSQQSINKYENHGVEPDINTLMRLSDYFHTSIDDLVGHAIPGGTPADRPDVSAEEYALIQGFRRLSADEKKSIRLVIQNYLKHK